MEVLFIKIYTMKKPIREKDFTIVNTGPRHPSMDGVLRLIITLDGENNRFSLTGLK